MPSTTAIARLEARISPELHALLKRAAALQDRTSVLCWLLVPTL